MPAPNQEIIGEELLSAPSPAGYTKTLLEQHDALVRRVSERIDGLGNALCNIPDGDDKLTWIRIRAETLLGELKGRLLSLELTLERTPAAVLSHEPVQSVIRHVHFGVPNVGEILDRIFPSSGELATFLRFISMSAQIAESLLAIPEELKRFYEHDFSCREKIKELEMDLQERQRLAGEDFPRHEDKKVITQLEQKKQILETTSQNASELKESLTSHRVALRNLIEKYRSNLEFECDPSNKKDLDRLFSETITDARHVLEREQRVTTLQPGVDQNSTRLAYFVGPLLIGCAVLALSSGAWWISARWRSDGSKTDRSRGTILQTRSGEEYALSIFLDEYLNEDEKNRIKNASTTVSARAALYDAVTHLVIDRATNVIRSHLRVGPSDAQFRFDGDKFHVEFSQKLVDETRALYGPSARVGLMFNVAGRDLENTFTTKANPTSLDIERGKICTPSLIARVGSSFELPTGDNLALDSLYTLHVYESAMKVGVCPASPDFVKKKAQEFLGHPFVARYFSASQKTRLLAATTMIQLSQVFNEEFHSIDQTKITAELGKSLLGSDPFDVKIAGDTVVISIKEEVRSQLRKILGSNFQVGIEHIARGGSADKIEYDAPLMARISDLCSGGKITTWLLAEFPNESRIKLSTGGRVDFSKFKSAAAPRGFCK